MQKRQLQRGQGLAEYAIVILLVAIVAVLVLGLLGLAVTRVYGLIGGALGSKKEADTHIYFDPDQLPRCGIYGGHTILYGQLYVIGISSNPAEVRSAVTVSTDTTFTIDLNENNPSIGLWNIQKDFGAVSDDGLCPRSIVVQTSKEYGGETLFYPVEIRDWS